MIEPSWRADPQPGNPELPLWTRAIIGDMLPEAVSPLGWTMIWEPAAKGFRDCLIERLGFDDEELRDDHPETVSLLGGFAYLNASVLRVWADRLPALGVEQIDPILVAGNKPLPTHQDPAWGPPDAVAAGMLGQWYDWVVSSRNQFELRRQIDLVAEVTAADEGLASKSDLELIEEAIGLRPLCQRLFSQHLNQTLGAFIGPRLLNQACIDVGQPAHTLRLLSGLGQIEPASPTLALWELSRLVRESRFLSEVLAEDPEDRAGGLRRSVEPDAIALLAGVDALIEEIAFRGPNEWDLSSPTWDEVPSIVLAMIGCLSRCEDSFAPRQRRQHLEADRYRLTVEIAAALGPEDRAEFVDAVQSSVAFIRGREESRTALMRVVHRQRRLLREAARRWVQRDELVDADDVWMLTLDELSTCAADGPGELRSVLAARRRDYLERRDDEPLSTVWLGGEAPSDWLADQEVPDADPFGSSALEPGDLVLGSPGSPGMARGPARIIETVADLADFRPGDILVMARPVLAATPVFVAAGAVIADAGDTFTHAVVVARELGTPMVVGARGASTRIRPGSIVNVDGLTGVISIVPDGDVTGEGPDAPGPETG